MTCVYSKVFIWFFGVYWGRTRKGASLFYCPTLNFYFNTVYTEQYFLILPKYKAKNNVLPLLGYLSQIFNIKRYSWYRRFS